MEKIAIIIEDMRMGGPQKQLLYFLQEVTKSNLKIKYQLIVPKKSKKKLSKFLRQKRNNFVDVQDYLTRALIHAKLYFWQIAKKGSQFKFIPIKFSDLSKFNFN